MHPILLRSAASGLQPTHSWMRVDSALVVPRPAQPTSSCARTPLTTDRMDVALLFFLIVLNAGFAMSEMALTTSRKARLQVMLEAGERGVEAAIDLHDHPTKFLSTVQVGITSISVLNGIVGDAAFSEPLGEWLHATFALSLHPAHITATALVVLIITVLTIIFGELVPKRIGQMFPETVAAIVAPPMQWLSMATRPLVVLLSKTTEAILRVIGIKGNSNRSVTGEEIA